MKAPVLKLAIGVSGGGTTFEAIAKAIKSNKIKLNLAFVFSDRDCGALEKAQKLGIKFVKRRSQESIHDFHSRIIKQLEREKVDFVALAGYLRLFFTNECQELKRTLNLKFQFRKRSNRS